MHCFFFSKKLPFLCLLTFASCSGLRPLSVKEEVNSPRKLELVDAVANVSPSQQIISDDLSNEEEQAHKMTFNQEKIAELTASSPESDEEDSEGLSENLSEKLDQDSETAQLDLHLNYKQEHYDFWLKYFTDRDKDRFVRHLKNGEEYREIIRAILKEEGLPADLFYVGLIESGYNLKIKSHASATGPWQFMKGTGRQYGLRVDSAVDERYNIYKATVAAAKYFRDLYNIFGSWELALCAYNAGEYRIIRAIRKGGTRDYRELVAKKLIPKETVYYIPKVAAARELSKRREHYGINVAKKDGRFYKNTILRKVKGRFQVSSLARDLGIEISEFKLLNPDLRHKVITTGSRGHRIVLPHRLMTKFDNNKNLKIRHASAPSSRKSYYHKVRSGENLTVIARKYGMSVGEIKRINRLKGDVLFVGQKVKLKKKSGTQEQREVASTQSESKSKASAKHQSVSYKVKKGDNLSLIARKFGTSYHAIKRLNSMRSSRVYGGQVLEIPTKYSWRVYTVKRGDTLIQIARRFQTSLNRIMAMNSLINGQIFPNQKLKIPSEG